MKADALGEAQKAQYCARLWAHGHCMGGLRMHFCTIPLSRCRNSHMAYLPSRYGHSRCRRAQRRLQACVAVAVHPVMELFRTASVRNLSWLRSRGSSLPRKGWICSGCNAQRIVASRRWASSNGSSDSLPNSKPYYLTTPIFYVNAGALLFAISPHFLSTELI